MSSHVPTSRRSTGALFALMLVFLPAIASAQWQSTNINYPPAVAGSTMAASAGVGAVGPSKLTVKGDAEIVDVTGTDFVTNGVDWPAADGKLGDTWVAAPIAGVPLYPTIVTGNGFAGRAQRLQYGQGTDTIPAGSYGFLSTRVPSLNAGTEYVLSFKYRSNRSLQVTLNANDCPVFMNANTGSAMAVSVIFFPSTTRNSLDFAAPGGGGTPALGDWLEVDDVSVKAVGGGNLKAHGTLTVDGNVGIGTPNPGSKLSVVGDITATGVISGANVQANYQDLAEWVPSDRELAAGTVVVLDPSKPNHVIASMRAYDSTVAGVISSEPGIILGKGGADRVKVATTGRVRVHVDAVAAPVRIGDLLVTSSRPGTAMKSAPVDVGGIGMHRPGTVIGKALEPLPSGEGDILVLLSLQ